MADISKEINDFKNAKYGKDVRNSMVSLAEKVNQESSDAAQTVSNYTAAETSRAQAEQDRQNAEALREQNFELMQSQSQDATNAANTAAERAEQAAEGDVSSKTVTFEMAAARAGVQSGDTLAVAFGKLAKFCADLQDHAFNPLVNNGLANVAGVSALDAVQANPDVEDTMANKIAKLYSDMSETEYEIEYYDGTFITFAANRVIRINEFHIFECIINIPNEIPDTTQICSIAEGLSGILIVTQPTSGKSYPIVVGSGAVKAWGAIPACNYCMLTGVIK